MDREAGLGGGAGPIRGAYRNDVRGRIDNLRRHSCYGAACRVEEQPIGQIGRRECQDVAVAGISVREEVARQRDRDDVAFADRQIGDRRPDCRRVVGVGDGQRE